MKYDEIMVRYGELSTKGHNKKSFIDRLGSNVRRRSTNTTRSRFTRTRTGCTWS